MHFSTPAKPDLSVIMPVFNRATLVGEAIESILKQSFSDFEFIIIDDGSGDETRTVLESHAQRDSRITILYGPHVGLTNALIRGIGAAQGRLIARMDADDASRSDRFEKQICFLNAHPECAAVGSAILVIDEDGDPIMPSSYPVDHFRIDRDLIEGRCSMSHPATMFRKTAYDEAGGYRPEYEPAEDLDLWLRMAEIGKLANLGETLLDYRVHPQCVTSLRNEEQANKTRKAITSARVRRKMAPLRTSPLRAVKGPSADQRLLGVKRGLAYMARHAGYDAASRKHARVQFLLAPWRFRSWRCFALCYFSRSLRHVVVAKRWLQDTLLRPEESGSVVAYSSGSGRAEADRANCSKLRTAVSGFIASMIGAFQMKPFRAVL